MSPENSIFEDKLKPVGKCGNVSGIFHANISLIVIIPAAVSFHLSSLFSAKKKTDPGVTVGVCKKLFCFNKSKNSIQVI